MSLAFLGLIIFMVMFMSKDAIADKGFSLKSFFDLKFSLASKEYGFGSIILGSISSTLLALLISLPISIFASVNIKFYLSKNKRSKLITMIKVLNTVPSVIYGFFGVSFIIPIIKLFNTNISGYSMLAGVLVLSLILIPLLIILIYEEVCNVNPYLIEAAYSLGCNKNTVIAKFVFPEIKKGIINASILALGRGLGEASAIMMVSGSVYKLSLNKDFLVSPFSTLTTTIATNVGGSSGVETSFLYLIGFILLIMILALNILVYSVYKEK